MSSTLGGDPDGDDDLRKQSRLAARAARFNNVLPGNRYKELEEVRNRERKAFLEQGLITSGKTQLQAAVDMRGTCEGMCSEYEIEFREFTREIHPFEATLNKRMDHAKAVAAYTRSDAGAGHGEAAKLPSDLRTPAALVRSLDYLINEILQLNPVPDPNAVNPPPPTPRRALGYTAGFIRDRTRAIRKEFAMQSSWGHDEAIASFERIARWHILCLRELQEESGQNTDMHIDSAELGRCFTSLRQQYNDRREELGVDLPCPNEPEFRAYMLIFDLANKSVSIPAAELPAVILDHPLVQLAWQIRQAAQRNFDSQKEGSKLNAELGANMITRFIRLVKQQKAPFLLSCLVEIRLREMRRSAIRALTRTYPRLKTEAIRVNEATGEVTERRMVLIPTLDRLLGAEEQELDDPAWDDIIPVSKNPDDEAVAVVERFGIQVYKDNTGPVGALINLSAPYNDNKDAPFTRRWRFITEKKSTASYADIVNGNAGVAIDGAGAAAPVAWVPPPRPQMTTTFKATPTQAKPSTAFGLPNGDVKRNGSAFANGNGSAFSTGSGSAFSQGNKSAFSGAAGAFSGVAGAFKPKKPSQLSQSTQPSAFGVTPSPSSTPAFPPRTEPEPTPPPPPASTSSIPSFFDKPPTPTPAAPPPPSFFPSQSKPEPPKPPAPSFNFFDKPKPAETAPPKPSAVPSFFSTPSPVASVPTTPGPAPMFASSKSPSPQKPPPEPVKPRIKVSRETMRRAAPALRDQLVAEVVAALVSTRESSLSKVVKQHEAALAHVRAKAERQALLVRMSKTVFDTMVAAHVHALAEAVYESEQRVRDLTRRIALHWRAWAARVVEARLAAKRERDQMFQRLSGMGLARSMAAFNPLALSAQPNGMSASVRSAHAGPRSTTTWASDVEDELEVDLELHETERARDRLFAESTFLTAISRHVAPLLSPEDIFETVLLTADHAGSPAPARAREWLASKLRSPSGGTARNGVNFATSVTDIHGDMPASYNTGLWVLEAPLDNISSTERAQNADDASDRIEVAAGMAQQRSRYSSALLILTWGDESLDEVVARLQIEDDVAQFDQVAAVSLEGAEDLEARFVRAVRQLVPRDPRKEQVVLHLDDIVARTEPKWHNLLHFVRHVLSSPTPTLIAAVMTSAISALSELPKLVDSALQDLPISAWSEYDPPALPLFPLVNYSDASVLATEIANYLSRPPLDAVDDVALAAGPIRQAAAYGRPLQLLPVLDALGAYVMGTVGAQRIPLDVWLAPGETPTRITDDVGTDFDAAIEQATTAIARVAREERERERRHRETREAEAAAEAAAQAEAAARAKARADDEERKRQAARDAAQARTLALAREQLARATAVPLPPSPKTPKSSAPSSPRNSLKRRADDTDETPAAKMARLLRTIDEANETLMALKGVV